MLPEASVLLNPLSRLTHWLFIKVAIKLATAFNLGDKPCALKNLQVLGDCGERNAKRSRQLAHIGLAAR